VQTFRTHDGGSFFMSIFFIAMQLLDKARNKISTRTYDIIPFPDSLIQQIKLILYNIHLCKLKWTNRNETERIEAKTNYCMLWTLTLPTSWIYRLRVLLHIGFTLIGRQGRRVHSICITKFFKVIYKMRHGLIICTGFN